MKYTIEICCRARTFCYNIVNRDLYRQLISCRDNGENIEEFYLKYLRKTDFFCECEQPHPYWVSDRFSLTVEDESGNVVYQTDNEEDIPIRMVNEQKFIVSKGMLFARNSAWKGHCEIYSFETDSFDASKLYFGNCQYNNDPYSDDMRIVDNISYEGADVEFEYDNSCEGEQYCNSYVVLFNEKKSYCEKIPLDELEKYTTYIVNE